jgi:metallo-beta-lactamase class B
MGIYMKNRAIQVVFGGIFALAAGGVLLAQADAQSSAAHRAMAKAAAGQEHLGLLTTVCPNQPAGGAAGRAGAGAGAGAGATRGAARGGAGAAAGASAGGARGAQGGAARGAGAPPAPARDTWHAEPVKVFDNLYWLGQTEYSVWAVTTSAGIIVIDTIFDYSVEDEVVGGMKKLGLDPATIKYVIVSHGHSDHSGGAKFLQDTFHPRVLMSAADWDLLARTSGTKPAKDMVVNDGDTLTLGDTTLTMYLTPGHTPGTISTIIPVKDHGQPHVVAEWGGTAYNFTITPDKDREYWFHTYIASALRFRAVAKAAGADVVIANHTNFDGSKTKLPAVQARKAGDPNPWVIGRESATNYMTVAVECAKAGLAELEGR